MCHTGNTAVRPDRRYNPDIMSAASTPVPAVEDFIARWQGVTASELTTAQEKLIHDKGLVAVLKSLHDQLAAVARILVDSPTAQTEAQLATNFTGKGRWKSRLPDILAALEALGRARRLDDGWWMG